MMLPSAAGRRTVRAVPQRSISSTLGGHLQHRRTCTRVAHPKAAAAPTDKGSLAVKEEPYIAGPYGSGRVSVDGAWQRREAAGRISWGLFGGASWPNQA